MRTRVKNQLRSIAVNQGLYCPRLWTQAGRRALQELSLAPWTARRRNDLLLWLQQLDRAVAPLDQAVERAAEQCPAARRLKTHPGVGAVTALAFVLTVGAPERFADRQHLASYFGLIPSESSSGAHQRFGGLSKQGNSFVRYLLIEAAQTAARRVRGDAELARWYARVSLAIRLWVMWRKRQTYTEWLLQPARMQARPSSPVV